MPGQKFDKKIVGFLETLRSDNFILKLPDRWGGVGILWSWHFRFFPIYINSNEFTPLWNTYIGTAMTQTLWAWAELRNRKAAMQWNLFNTVLSEWHIRHQRPLCAGRLLICTVVVWCYSIKSIHSLRRIWKQYAI